MCRNRPSHAVYGLADRLLAAHVQGAERVAVVRAPPRDDGRACVLAARQVIRTRHLDRGLDRLAATGHRVDPRIVHGQMRGQLVGVGLERLGREHGAVHVLGLVQLLDGRVDQRAVAVSDVQDDRSARAVQVALPVGVHYPRALRRHRGRQRTGQHPREDVAHGTIITARSVPRRSRDDPSLAAIGHPT